MALGANLKFYTSLSKGLKLKFRRFWALVPTFVEVTGEKLVGDAFLPPIPNRVKTAIFRGNISTTAQLLNLLVDIAQSTYHIIHIIVFLV